MEQPPQPENETSGSVGERDAAAHQWLTLLRQLEPLKHLPRAGWVDREVSEPESVAAHSWRLALLAWFAAAAEGLDAGYAMQLALVHDVPEAITGDHTPFDSLAANVDERLRLASNPPGHDQWHAADARANKHAAERRAMALIVAGTTPEIGRRMTELWEDYAAEDSAEARLVHQLDKLEAHLQGYEYAQDGRLKRPETLRSFRVDTDRLATEPAAKALYRAIEEWARAAGSPALDDASTPE